MFSVFWSPPKHSISWRWTRFVGFIAIDVWIKRRLRSCPLPSASRHLLFLMSNMTNVCVAELVATDSMRRLLRDLFELGANCAWNKHDYHGAVVLNRQVRSSAQSD